MEISCGISEGKKRDAPSKDFWTHCTVGTGVVKRWRGEDVGRHLCLTSQLRQVSTAIFLLNIRKKIRRWENGTLNNFKLQEFGLTLVERKYAAYFTLDMKIKINFYDLNWHKSPWLFSCEKRRILKGMGRWDFEYFQIARIFPDLIYVFEGRLERSVIWGGKLWSWKWKHILMNYWNQNYTKQSFWEAESNKECFLS